jgi:hypothetical protein
MGVSSEADAVARLKRTEWSSTRNGATRFVRTDNVRPEDAAAFNRFVAMLESKD